MKTDNPKTKETLEAFENVALHFAGAGDALTGKITEQDADNGHAQVNLRAIRRAEQAGINYTEKPAEDGGTARVREPNGELAKWEKIYEEGKAASKELRRKQNELYSRSGNCAHAGKLAKAFLSKLPAGTELIFSNQNAIKRKNENDPDALVRIESEILGAFDLRKKTLRAPKSVDEKKECWTAQVRKLAKSGEPDWLGLHGANGKEARLHGYFIDGIARTDGVALAMWAFEDALIQKGHKAIEEFSALEGDGLSAEARAAAIADLDSVIFEKEAEYETIWLSLARNGVFVPRRKIFSNDARPLLGLSSDMPRIEIKAL